MIEELEAARAAWEKVKDYKLDAVPAVWAEYQAYRAEDLERYPYNAAIEAWMIKRNAIPEHLHDFLGTQVYLAQHQRRRAEEETMRQYMKGEGFEPIEWDTAYRGAVRVVAKKEFDFMAVRTPETGKFITDGRGGAFFLPKGKRTRGYVLAGLKGYYKPIMS